MRCLCLLLLLTLLSCEREPVAGSGANFAASPSPDWNHGPAFWMWGPSSGLNQFDRETLASLDDFRLYWQVGETGASATHTGMSLQYFAQRRADILRSHPSSSIAPTIRIQQGAENLTSLRTFENLVYLANQSLPRIVGPDAPLRRLQIDFDCPASLLLTYADRLDRLRRELDLDEISVTALASWIDAPRLRHLLRIRG